MGTTQTVRAAALAVLAAAALAACSSTTDGTDSGHATTPTTAAATATAPTAPVAPATTPPVQPSSASTPSSTPPSSAPSTGPSTVPAPATPLRTVTTTPTDDGRTYVVKVWADHRDTTCQDHAYGKPVIKYLTVHPCRGMERLLATTTVNGRAVGFSQISLSIPGTARDPYVYAGGFKSLVTRDGTGSIDDLLREGYRLPSGPTAVPTPDAFDCIGQDNGIDIYDAWYLQGPTPDNDRALVQMTQDVFLQV